MRFLYLLALFQLVAGPLVLFQVTVLCKLTVREAPGHGVTTAVVKAFESPEFQALLSEASVLKLDGSKSPLPANDPQGKDVKVKMPSSVAWQVVPWVVMNPSQRVSRTDLGRTWTPAWPQAPPGTPPRIG